MSTLTLLWNTTWRGGAWGLLAGASLSMAYGATFANLLVFGGMITQPLGEFQPGDIPAAIFVVFLMAFLGAIMGGIFGIPTGFAVGATNGFLFGIITRLFFFPPRNTHLYHRVMALSSGLFTGIASWVGFILIWQLYMNDEKGDLGAGIIMVTVPAIIAGIAAAFMSRLGTRWYEKAISNLENPISKLETTDF
jgi:hypothetical protein